MHQPFNLSFSESIPSGHILTVQELQVLRTLLAPYTDEKLKELQLLIQRKEEGEISREEVEKSLRQSGLTMVADRLKDDIEKGKFKEDCVQFCPINKLPPPLFSSTHGQTWRGGGYFECVFTLNTIVSSLLAKVLLSSRTCNASTSAYVMSKRRCTLFEYYGLFYKYY